MTAPKGYTTQKKEIAGSNQFATVNPATEQRFGLDTIGHIFCRTVGSDAVEANSTTTTINATAHAALCGDVIRITSGTLNGKEVVVLTITANAINLAETLASAPATAVTFDILRHTRPQVAADGSVKTSGASANLVAFTRDAVQQDVTEDTSVAANNRPLPVKLTNTNGEVGTSSHPLRTDTTGTTTQPISAVALPLPAGASTSAKQPALGTAGSSSVDVISVQGIASGTALPISAAALPLPSGAATSAKQPALGTAGSSSTDVISVQGIASGTAMPISAAALPLPSGAATSALQTALNAQIPTTLGQKTMANALAVSLASDQSAISVKLQDGSGSSVAKGQTTMSGSLPVVLASDQSTIVTTQDKSATATVTSVAGSATTVSLLASTSGRKNATFFNDSTQILYLKLGTTASTSSYTVQIAAGGYYELPLGRTYTGAIDGIWASANGNVRITELT